MFMILLTFLFTPGLVPVYLIVRNLGLIDSVWSLILPSLTSGWYVLLMKGFFDGIPDSLDEAARIDGCTEISVFWRIIIPLSLPAIVAFGLFFAVGYWNTYFNGIMFINQQSKWPLQVLLQNMLVDPTTMGGGEQNVSLQMNQAAADGNAQNGRGRHRHHSHHARVSVPSEAFCDRRHGRLREGMRHTGLPNQRRL